jgi:hypothetical protein
MGNRSSKGKARIMHESTSWEHYAEESLTHDDYGTRPEEDLTGVEIPMFFQTELRSDGEWPR